MRSEMLSVEIDMLMKDHVKAMMVKNSQKAKQVM